jgi:hypothetical protein
MAAMPGRGLHGGSQPHWAAFRSPGWTALTVQTSRVMLAEVTF